MRTFSRSSSILGLAISGLLTFAGCSDSAPGPVDPGDAEPASMGVSITSNLNGIAAFTATISGGPVDDVQSVGDAIVYWETAVQATKVTVLSSGPASGQLFSIRVPDSRIVDRYSIQVDEVADIGNDVRDPSSLSIELR